MKTRLALGHQEFSTVIRNECIYVDKTEDIYRLIKGGSYYFLSRPRRFGKSLLANTIKELFRGSKEMFKGLWIYDKWDWEKKYPVIKISFSNISHNVIGLEQAIHGALDYVAEEKKLVLKSGSYPEKFQELITKLSEKSKVIVIIDEYDKPIIDHMDDIPKAEQNRDILKNFYSVIKDSDEHIRFLFITGVSKFSHVSIFSDLNNLVDITVDENYPEITGFTKTELENYFPGYIKRAGEKYKDIYPDIMKEIKNWYNGYSWDGKTRVYNPVSVMNFFSKRDFRNYWFSTGTPTMLMDIIKEQKLTAFDIEESYTSSEILDKYDFKNIKFSSLLFQTGYLTIDSINIRNRRIKLDYPNNEVREAFSKHILAEQTRMYLDESQSLLFKIIDSFIDNKIDVLIGYLNTLFKNIPYSLVENKESYFHSLFYLVVKLTGFEIETEVLTIDGRIDAVIKTDSHIYIVEFKINQSAKKAIGQINDKEYQLKYTDDKRPVSLLGINFDTEKKKIDDYLLEHYQ
ncbi:MAG: AAA family ATPase [Bacteroidota bacterium]